MIKLAKYAIAFFILLIILVLLVKKIQSRKAKGGNLTSDKEVIVRTLNARIPEMEGSERKSSAVEMTRGKLISNVEMLLNTLPAQKVYYAESNPRDVAFMRKLFPLHEFVVVDNDNLGSIDNLEDVNDKVIISNLSSRKFNEELCKIKAAKKYIRISHKEYSDGENLKLPAGDIYILPYDTSYESYLLLNGGTKKMTFVEKDYIGKLNFINNKMRKFGYDTQVERSVSRKYHKMIGHVTGINLLNELRALSN